jgi:2-(1,2-epoxy-1,2-dihydrophenyl)acetyl-CoA isomerase
LKYFFLEQEEGVTTLTINRPDRLNAFNWEMERELFEAINQIEKDEDTRVLVITGAGRAFSTGADIEDQLKVNVERGGLTGEEMYDSPLRDMVPTIASINGLAVGAGMTLALQCDIRIASEEAKMQFPFVQVGAIPEFGSTYTLPRLVGIDRACELVLTGRMIEAKEAKDIGLVTEVVPASELKEATYKLARKIAQNPPLAAKEAKKGLYRGIQVSREESIEFEKSTLIALLNTEDHKEAISAFMEKRKPRFKGK